MGAFGNKKKYYVSSTVYNLAGDEDKRPNFLKATVIGAVIAGKDSLAQAIQDAYATGPGTRLKRFNNWAENQGYNDLVGSATSTFNSGNNIDNSLLALEIPSISGGVIEIRTSEIDPADYSYWADQYVFLNNPNKVLTEYRSDMDFDTNTITITYEDLTTDSFIPTDFDIRSRYLYASYVESNVVPPDPVITGLTVVLGSMDSFPSVIDWTENSNVSSPTNVDLDTITTTNSTYSDGRTPTSTSATTTRTEVSTDVHGEWEKSIYQGILTGTDGIYSTRYIMYQDTVNSIDTTTTTSTTTETISGGVIKTTVTTIVDEIIVSDRSHRTDTQRVIHKTWSPLSIFIYKFGSGNAVLDNMFTTDSAGANYYPIVPIRLNNVFISDYADTTLYKAAKKAFRKATASKFDDVETTIKDNPSIGDIDYAYAVFGVSLNVKEQSCRKYLYRFFKAIAEEPGQLTQANYDTFLDEWDAASASIVAWNDWFNRPPGARYYSNPEPVVLPYPARPINRMSITNGVNPQLNYSIELSWSFLYETTGSGLLKPDAKKNEIWLTTEPLADLIYIFRANGDNPPSPGLFGKAKLFSWRRATHYVVINWQVDLTTWKKITIHDLTYKNFIYGSLAVIYTGKEAVESTEESGFIIPLQEGIYKSMGRKHNTQMATACCFLVFNSYLEVKTPWYATTVFKVLLIVVIVVITIFAPPVGAGAAKAAMATGTFLGLSGTAALIGGFIVNYVAAAIVTNLIMKAATHVFGVKIGTIIGTIVSIATLQVGNSLLSGQSIAASFGKMMSSINLLKLTIPIGNAYANYLGSVTKDLQIQSQKLNDEFTSKSKEIEDKYKEMFGDGVMLFDPKLLTEHNAVLGETPSAFLERTLMTGGDIVDMSLDMLHNFVDITLSTELK